MRGRKHTNLLLCSHNFVESQPREQFRIAIYLFCCLCIRSRSSTACWGEYTAKGLILLLLIIIIINNLCYCNTNWRRLKPEQHVAIMLLEVWLVQAITRTKNQRRRLSYHMSVTTPATKSTAEHLQVPLLLAVNTFPAGCHRWDNFTCSE